MNTSVDEVATAIWWVNEGDRWVKTWDELQDSVKESYRYMAKAAIKAITGEEPA